MYGFPLFLVACAVAGVVVPAVVAAFVFLRDRGGARQ